MKVGKNLEKYLWKSSCLYLFFKDFAKIKKVISFWNFEIQEQLFSKEYLFFLNKISNVFWNKKTE